MSFLTPESGAPAAAAGERPAWQKRLKAAGVVVLCSVVVACLATYRMEEMGWALLNTGDAVKASTTPCSNALGVPGLYAAGILLALFGAGAYYLCALAAGVALVVLVHPRARLTGQITAAACMLVCALAALSLQPWVLHEWAAARGMLSAGGCLGYWLGDCLWGAILGPKAALVLLIAGHATAMIYYARLRAGEYGRGVMRLARNTRDAIRAAREARKERALRPSDAWGAPFTPRSGAPNLATALPQETAPALPSAVLPEYTPPMQQRTPAPRMPEPEPAPGTPEPPAEQAPLPTPLRRKAVRRDDSARYAPPPPKPEEEEAPRRPAPAEEPRRLQPLPPMPKPEPQAPPPQERMQRRDEAPLRGAFATRNDRSNLLGLMPQTEEELRDFRPDVPPELLDDTPPPINPATLDGLRRALGRDLPEKEEEPRPPQPTPPMTQPEPRPTPTAPAAIRRPEPPPAAPYEDEREMYDDYPLPPYELLDYHPVPIEVQEASRAEMQEKQAAIMDTFATFRMAVEAGDITCGPSFTRFEFVPPRNIRVKSFEQMGKDIMLATGAKSVNILAPIPGLKTVGVELENSVKTPVYLRELLKSAAFANPKLRIPVALGKDVYGNPVIGDLAEMPHTLVAGTTGSGKSVCINSMIISMLYKFRPDELRLILVDPKVVEMQPYKKLPHLACPVVTNPARVIGALRWAVNEMEHRYRLFSRCGVRKFEDFNNRENDGEPEEEEEVQDNPNFDVEAFASEIERQAEEEIPLGEEEQGELDFEEEERIPLRLPYIVIIIDELADLMMAVKEDLENYIARLTQKARAAGIHLVVATQTPRSNVVTGIIKANIPSRIALKVSSNIDSRVILDTNGAENLLGKGDFLFVPPGGITKLTRAQGAWVSDAEISSIVHFCASHAKQHFEQGVTAEMNNAEGVGPVDTGSPDGGLLAGSKATADDELYTRCVNLVVTERNASTSLLQRRFSIGYSKAARIMDMMQERGVISAPLGPTKKREILVDAPDTPEG